MNGGRAGGDGGEEGIQHAIPLGRRLQIWAGGQAGQGRWRRNDAARGGLAGYPDADAGRSELNDDRRDGGIGGSVGVGCGLRREPVAAAGPAIS